MYVKVLYKYLFNRLHIDIQQILPKDAIYCALLLHTIKIKKVVQQYREKTNL